MLEATIIVVDNSEPSRNGDYLPSRYDAQSDAVHLIFQAKTSSNPESSVGLMTSAGANTTSPQVLTTLTTDEGKLVHGLSRTKVGGQARVATTLSVASLALKHRQNKSQHPRVVIFSCSALRESKDELVKLGRKLKKGGVAVDVIVLGEGALQPAPSDDAENPASEEANTTNGDTAPTEPTTREKWAAFHAAIRGPADAEHQSHLAVIRPGDNLLSDAILTTDILSADGVGGGGAGAAAGAGDAGEGGAGGAGQFEEFGGVDPNADPELALALRMSMEEEERRRAQREREEDGGGERLESVPEEGGSGSGSGTGSGENKEGSGERMDES